MGSKVDRTLPENAIIAKEEKKIGEIIKRKINKYIMQHEINKNKLKNPLNTFNPLTSHLYFKISYLYFKTFINYYKENAELNFGDDNTSGSASASVSKRLRILSGIPRTSQELLIVLILFVIISI